MKNLKNKKKLGIIIFIIIVLIIGVLAIFQVVTKEKVEKIDNYYTVQLKNNDEDILTFTFHEGYLECSRFNKTEICSDIVYNIDTTKLYIEIANIDDYIFGDDLNDIINNINKFIKDQELEDVIITSDYQFKADDFEAIFNYEENLDDYELNDEYYTISFDTDGGSSIDSVVVKSGEKIDKPDNPSKDGYSFVNWEYEGREYNFDNGVTSNLTLKAIWKKNSTSSSNNISSGSSSSNINLINMSATIYKVSTGSENCFFYMYHTNLESMYPDIEIDKYNGINNIDFCPFPKSDCSSSEIALEDLNNLTYDTNKENTLENTLKKYDNTPGFNLISFSNNNHKISLEYEYITFNGLDVADGTNAHKQIQDALNNSYYAMGPCGGYNYYENVTITEEICEQFNLDCE